MVISGAGASAISCAKLAMRWGVKKEHIMMLDSKGVIYKGRTEGMNKYKEEFVIDTDCRTLADAVRGADVFLGLSIANVLTPKWSSPCQTGHSSAPWPTRPRDQVRAGQGSQPARHHRHRPLGLSEPGQ